MKKIIVTLLFTTLFLAISPKSHIIGGDSAFAVTYEELNMYEVRIENNLSKVITTMAVMAEDEQQARENVSLNGWTIIGVRLLKERVKESYDLDTELVSTAIPNEIELEGRINIPIDNQSNGKNDIVISKDAGNTNIADNLELLPTSKELELILTIHFGLGNVSPVFNDDISKIFESLPKNRDYVLFGNADDVRVGRNATYSSNYELSFLRAEHIKKLLIEKGYNADKIRTVGLGTRYPLEKNGKNGSFKNRRVEIYGFRAQR